MPFLGKILSGALHRYLGSSTEKFFPLMELPEELILHVFSYLLQPNLANLSLVSKDIRVLSEDNQLWQPLWHALCDQHRIPHTPLPLSFKNLNKIHSEDHFAKNFTICPVAQQAEKKFLFNPDKFLSEAKPPPRLYNLEGKETDVELHELTDHFKDSPDLNTITEFLHFFYQREESSDYEGFRYVIKGIIIAFRDPQFPTKDKAIFLRLLIHCAKRMRSDENIDNNKYQKITADYYDIFLHASIRRCFSPWLDEPMDDRLLRYLQDYKKEIVAHLTKKIPLQTLPAISLEDYNKMINDMAPAWLDPSLFLERVQNQLSDVSGIIFHKYMSDCAFSEYLTCPRKKISLEQYRAQNPPLIEKGRVSYSVIIWLLQRERFLVPQENTIALLTLS